jgi:hypothetical protein
MVDFVKAIEEFQEEISIVKGNVSQYCKTFPLPM